MAIQELPVRLMLLLALIALAVPAAARERPREPRRPTAAAPIDPLPGTERIAIDISGTTRRYLLHAPAGGAAPRALVLVFHPAGGQAAQAERLSRFSALADELGFVAAYPEGIDGQWQAVQDPRSEVTFTRTVIEDIRRRTPIDRARVFAAGVANGALVAAALGCFAPDAVAGVALVAGGYVSPCRNSPRAPAILFNGPTDTPASARRAGMPVRDFALDWGSGPGCRAGAETLPARGALRVDRFACGGAEAVLWTVAGGGPAWPATAPDTTREIWRFFAALR
jgi:polyhydroxybutyrate depolymerase